MIPIRALAAACLLTAFAQLTCAADDIYPAAILPFTDRGLGTTGKGDQVSELLFVELAGSEHLILVDRMELDATLQEHELNLSGMVNSQEAIRVGQLTGAKLLVTGSVMEVGNKLYLIAKIISTETTRVLAATAKGKAGDDIDTLVVTLGEKISAQVAERGSELVPEPKQQEDVVNALKQTLGPGDKPSLFIRIDERHVGQITIDPAAETEITQLSRESGFTVIDPDTGRENAADILVSGEGFSEFAMRRGNLVSVKARVEVKAVNTETDEIIASDSQVAVMVDLTEQLAGKGALQKAARQIAIRLLPKLIEE